MLSLIVKGIEFEDQLLSFSAREHKTPEYLTISPRGKVPTLVDGDTIVNESLAIIAYVDRKVPSPPLFGETPAEAGRIAQRIQEHEAYLGKAAMDAIGPVFRGKAKEQAEQMREKSSVLSDELAKFEAALGDDPWLGGDRVSAADIVFYPTANLIDRVAMREDLAELDLGLEPLQGRLADLKKRFADLPGVDRAHPPHWNS